MLRSTITGFPGNSRPRKKASQYGRSGLVLSVKLVGKGATQTSSRSAPGTTFEATTLLTNTLILDSTNASHVRCWSAEALYTETLRKCLGGICPLEQKRDTTFNSELSSGDSPSKYTGIWTHTCGGRRSRWAPRAPPAASARPWGVRPPLEQKIPKCELKSGNSLLKLTGTCPREDACVPGLEPHLLGQVHTPCQLSLQHAPCGRAHVVGRVHGWVGGRQHRHQVPRVLMGDLS